MRELVRAGLIGVATAALGLALALSPLGASLEERLGLTWLFSLRGAVEAPGDVVVVGLDRRSAERMGLPEKIRDWPRDLYARLIKGLDEGGAPVVVFDLILEREREAGFDALLVEAIRGSGKVVLFEALELQREPVGGGALAALGLLETQRLRPPINDLAEAAAGLGPFPLPIVPDRVSQVWLFQPGAGGRPTLPAVAVQQRAIGVFERWLSLLNRAGAHGLDAVSPDGVAPAGADELRSAMIAFREAFLADPTLGERVRDEIEAAGVEGPTKRLLLALTDLYEGPDSRYLNFYGPAGTIRTVSLADVLVSGKSTRSWQDWKDRGVFVGQSELYEPHSDAFATVYSRADGVKISGVEIAATVFSNLLDGRLIEPSRWWLVAIAGFGLLIGVIAGLLPALWAAPACLAVAGLYVAGAELAFSRAATWLPTTVPLLAELPLGLFAGLLLQYREARRARENLSKAIRYYLPDRIAEGFADAPEAPLHEDEEAYAYCLITDAAGFTSIAETMSSKQLKPFLEDYLAILFEAVETHGGRVTDSVGDGITAAFTAKTPDPAIAAKACAAALAIDRAVERFNTRHDPLRLPTRIGINAGWVTLGHVGGAGRFTYTVIGDAVNTASRIEQLNKHLGTRILATRAVVEGVPDLALLRPLGRFQLYGKEEVLEMVELRDTKEAVCFQQRDMLFAEALSFSEERRWESAIRRFTKISSDFKDKAAGLHIETCRNHLNDPSLSQTRCVIRLDVK